jgi:peptidoglycan/xylan/chitin deacetylase (PgdA/CDA1 family)
LLILCYHGISVQDEHEWWPGVFMTESRFRRRLQILKDRNYRVYSLSEALQKMDNGSLPARSVVITADDGYRNSPTTLVKACSDFGFQITIYVTSYYAEKQTPIFNVMVQYVFWKTEKSELRGDFSNIGLPDIELLDLSSEGKRRELAQKIIKFGKQHCNESERQDILKTISAQMNLDYAAMEASGMFKVMSAEDISLIVGQGVDIQLHTHRHIFPADKSLAIREIDENRKFLEPLAGKALNHFCFPSGLWDRSQLPWLRELGVQSATTCHLGFVTPASDKLHLNRYLDKETISDNEFVAEISGFLNLARRVRGRARSLWR